MTSITMNDPEIVRLLINAGAEIKVADDQGRTAMDYALSNFIRDNGEAKDKAYQIMGLLKAAGASKLDAWKKVDQNMKWLCKKCHKEVIPTSHNCCPECGESLE
jgi:ankyrin repeat protein